MLQRTLAEELPSAPPSRAAILQRFTPCDESAFIRLTQAFNRTKPGAILVGDGKARSTQVVDKFLQEVDDTTCVVRVPSPCTDPTSCMKSVIRTIGFEPKDHCLIDLKNIFTMFLGHQRSHGRRTVICIEDAHVSETWVLNMVLELIEQETLERYGLFVILSGQRQLRDLLYQEPLQYVVALAGHHIPVSPLGLAECKEFISQQVQSMHVQEVNEIVKFEAVTLMHEIGVGNPDTVSQLCFKSMELAADSTVYPITPHVVRRAACLLGLILDDTATTVELKGLQDDNLPPSADYLTIELKDNRTSEYELSSDCVSIGRDAKNDLCIPSLAVSRHHVLIVTSNKGVTLMDLGSTNGTFVNGEKVNSGLLSDGDKIRVGDCRITYVAAESISMPAAQTASVDQKHSENVSIISKKRILGDENLDYRRQTHHSFLV